MKYRPLGGTGLSVSEIGFGAWGIGGMTAGETSYGATDDARSLAALERALEIGVTFFDTAAAYGDGHSEELIGAACAGQRHRVVIATKAGLESFDCQPDFSSAGIRRSLEGSLVRLRTDYVDLFQLHNPPPNLFQDNPGVYAMLEDLKRQGMIRSFGVSVKAPHEALAILRHHHLASIQINLNMFDVRAVEAGLLDVAAERKIGIIARTPLSFGFLSGAVTADTPFPPGDHRRRWPRAQLERWVEGARAMNAAADAPAGQTRSQVALRFCLSFAAVSTVIPGILTPAEAEENGAASEFGPLPGAACRRILDLNRTQSFFVGS
jgi:aryl-alcohol dehydrogenase-like predicted oxidoreductase